ncbi:hypothetical protein M427DRAFT_373382 [Gonapodya prolifera JEL478]|uniref:Uncharacterized protein n=1 Tax=Gonapodya prolifera (strain JEL478) TaxID=1344416 RepID=A0A139AUF9_GONPJ|nr:hypothetical protein M427DRAFT_373382 [Gonapodya prolifera JEL478]|eukprot:KXS20347.1 hypothetical protein M427DRAFT_373382 [Gonapodya prolifera JEL478]
MYAKYVHRGISTCNLRRYRQVSAFRVIALLVSNFHGNALSIALTVPKFKQAVVFSNSSMGMYVNTKEYGMDTVALLLPLVCHK